MIRTFTFGIVGGYGATGRGPCRVHFRWRTTMRRRHRPVALAILAFDSSLLLAQSPQPASQSSYTALYLVGARQAQRIDLQTGATKVATADAGRDERRRLVFGEARAAILRLVCLLHSFGFALQSTLFLPLQQLPPEMISTLISTRICMVHLRSGRWIWKA